MNKIKLNRTTLIARTSTLTNAIVHSVVPYDSNEKINRVLNERFNDVHVCQYCGLGAKSLDHLFPLVVNKKLSGYISDANNLIPCCKDCNSSKGNTQWDIWFKNHFNMSDSESITRFEFINDLIKKYPPTKLRISGQTNLEFKKIVLKSHIFLESLELECNKIKNVLSE